MRLLVGEDDRQLAMHIRQSLVEKGHMVDVAHDGENVWLLAGTEAYDVVILDIMLPGRSGLDVLRELRAAKVTAPVLLLSARDALNDKVAGLDLGADDYMTKPFAMAELLARIRSISRRKGTMVPPVLSCGELTLHVGSRQVFFGDQEIFLTAKEFALLQYLLSNKDMVVTRSEIVEKVWDMNFDMFSDVLKVMVSRLRRKLEATGEQQLIHTVRGVGYMIKEPDNGHET